MDNELRTFKDRTPYTVPEGFFEQSKANILAAIAEPIEQTSTQEMAKTVQIPRRKSRKSFWMSIAAAAVVVAIVGGLALPIFRSDASELAVVNDTATTPTMTTTIDETAQNVGLYALALDDDDDLDAWTDFADDDLFLQE